MPSIHATFVRIGGIQEEVAKEESAIRLGARVGHLLYMTGQEVLR